MESHSASWPALQGQLQTATLLVLGSLTVLAGAVIAPSLPGLAAAYVTTPDAALLARLALTATALSIALTAPFSGWAIDRWGGRAVLLIALTGYGLCGSAGLWVDGLHALIATRVGFGVMVGGLMAATNALIARHYRGERRQSVLAWQAVATGVSGLVFLSAGGLLANWHWRGPFAVYFIAWLLLPLVVRAIPRDPPVPATTPTDAKSESELSRLTSTLLLALATSIAFYLLPTQGPFLLQQLGVQQPGWIGISIGLATVSSALASMSYRWLRIRVQSHNVYATGFAIVGLGHALAGTAASLPLTMIGLCVSGWGIGWLMPHLMVTGLDSVPARRHGAAAGRLTSAIFLGQFLSPLVVQPIVSRTEVGDAFGIVATACLAIAAGVAALARRNE